MIIDSEYDYIYAKLPKIADYDRTVHDYKVVLADQRAELARRKWDPEWLLAIRRELNEFKSSENSAISFMVAMPVDKITFLSFVLLVEFK